MDVNNLGTVQPAAPSVNRPQNAARETPRAAAGSTGPETESTALAAPQSYDDADEQPDPSTPRGSLLDISV